MWDPAYRNLEHSALRESLCLQRNIQIIQYKIMETVCIQEVTWRNFQSWDSSQVLDNEGCWIIVWWIKGVLLHVHLKCWCLLPSYTQHYSIASQKKPILISEFLIYILGSLYLKW
jgi:hypothetical protein